MQVRGQEDLVTQKDNERRTLQHPTKARLEKKIPDLLHSLRMSCPSHQL